MEIRTVPRKTPKIFKNTSRNCPPPAHFWLGTRQKYWTRRGAPPRRRPRTPLLGHFWKSFHRTARNRSNLRVFFSPTSNISAQAHFWRGFPVFFAAKSDPAAGNFYWSFWEFPAPSNLFSRFEILMEAAKCPSLWKNKI